MLFATGTSAPVRGTTEMMPTVAPADEEGAPPSVSSAVAPEDEDSAPPDGLQIDLDDDFGPSVESSPNPTDMELEEVSLPAVPKEILFSRLARPFSEP